MFTSIVVPVDLEPDGDRALPLAGALASRRHPARAGERLVATHAGGTRSRRARERRGADHWSVTCSTTTTSWPRSPRSSPTVRRARPHGHPRRSARPAVAGQRHGGLLGRLSQPMLLVGPHVELTSRSIARAPGRRRRQPGHRGGAAGRRHLDADLRGPPPWLVEVADPRRRTRPSAGRPTLGRPLATAGVRPSGTWPGAPTPPTA